MSGPPSKAEELRQQIEAAFAETKYPGDDRLVYDNTGDHLECNEVAAAFRGRDWRQLSQDILRRHSQSLFFLTPEAYRFYLPAYLNAATLHYDEADTIPGSVVFSLIPPSDARDARAYQRRIEGFTQAQRKAIRSFLEFLKQNHTGDDALGDVDKALANL
jgi:hypothetical protein